MTIQWESYCNGLLRKKKTAERQDTTHVNILRRTIDNHVEYSDGEEKAAIIRNSVQPRGFNYLGRTEYVEITRPAKTPAIKTLRSLILPNLGDTLHPA